MTTKFKAGDKVRFKDTPEDQYYRMQHWPLSAKESVFTVIDVNAGNGCLNFGACYGNVNNVGTFTSRFELVTKNDPKALKVGDVVRFKETLSDQTMRRHFYPASTKESTFTVTYADDSYLKLDGRGYSHHRSRFELVKAAPESAVLDTRPEKLILDEVPLPTKGVPLQSHIVVLKTPTGLRPEFRPFVYVTKKFAEDEAKRLAKENPGQTFVVFSSDNEVVSSKPVVTVTKHATV